MAVKLQVAAAAAQAQAEAEQRQEGAAPAPLASSLQSPHTRTALGCTFPSWFAPEKPLIGWSVPGQSNRWRGAGHRDSVRAGVGFTRSNELLAQVRQLGGNTGS